MREINRVNSKSFSIFRGHISYHIDRAVIIPFVFRTKANVVLCRFSKFSIASCDVFLPIQALLRNRKRFSFIIVYNMTKLYTS